MPITYVSENDQQEKITLFNKDKSHLQIIPLMARNLETGWPLLQISFLTPLTEPGEIPLYQPVLGGGNCHYFQLSYFSFISLLNKIPGKKEIKSGRGLKKELSTEMVSLNNITCFLEGYRFRHQLLGITLSSRSHAYGKVLSITLPPEWDKDTFARSFDQVLSYALREGKSIPTFGNYYDSQVGVDETFIHDCIKDDRATFKNGQLFIDLGNLLKYYDENAFIMIDDLKRGFKVDEWLSLNTLNNEPEMSSHSNNCFFKPSSDQSRNEGRSSETKEPLTPLSL